MPRASSQLNSAVRALPTCSWPVGLGANRTRIDQLMLMRIRRTRTAAGSDRLRSSAIAWTAIASPRPTASTPSLVLPLMLTRVGVDAERRGDATRASRRRRSRASGARAITVTSTLPTSKPLLGDERDGAPQQVEARRRPSSADRCRESAGRCRPAPAAPRIASVTAWQTTSASECPSAPRSNGIVTPPRISGRPSTSRCRS